MPTLETLLDFSLECPGRGGAGGNAGPLRYESQENGPGACRKIFEEAWRGKQRNWGIGKEGKLLMGWVWRSILTELYR